MKLAQIFGNWEASELAKCAPPNNRCLVDTHVNQQDLPYLTAIRPRSSKPLDACHTHGPFSKAFLEVLWRGLRRVAAGAALSSLASAHPVRAF